jgi:hypothetical protein
MNTTKFQVKRFLAHSLVVSGLSMISTGLFAQPVVTYTTTGTRGHYTLDFTVNNSTPGTDGFDIYYFGVLVNGQLSSTPSGFNGAYFSNLHTLEVTGPASNWAFNNYWIDPGYDSLPTGKNLSGFEVSDTDQSAPTSVQYFALGYDAGVAYRGPDNENLSSPNNPPLFTGYALTVIPEPTTFPLVAGALLLSLSAKRWLSDCQARLQNKKLDLPAGARQHVESRAATSLSKMH